MNIFSPLISTSSSTYHSSAKISHLILMKFMSLSHHLTGYPRNALKLAVLTHSLKLKLLCLCLDAILKATCCSFMSCLSSYIFFENSTNAECSLNLRGHISRPLSLRSYLHKSSCKIVFICSFRFLLKVQKSCGALRIYMLLPQVNPNQEWFFHLALTSVIPYVATSSSQS